MIRSNLIGICYGLGNAFCLALTGFLAKQINGYNPLTLMVSSGLWSVVFLTLLNDEKSVWINVGRIREKGHVMSFVASVCFMPLAAFFLFIALNFIEYADAMTITQSSIVCSSILAFIVLREPLKAVDIFCISMALAGVFLITRPLFIFEHFGVEKSSHYPVREIGAVLSALTAFCIAVFAVGRRCVVYIDSLFLSTCQGYITLLVGCLGALILLHLTGKPVLPHCTAQDRFLIMAAGFVHATCFLCNIQVFKYLSVVHSTTVKTSVSAFSYALQCIFSVEPFSCLSISGCCLILASVFLKSYASFTLKDFTKIFSKGNQNLV